MTSSRLPLGAPCLALTLLVACGGSGPLSVATCAVDPDCGEGAYCQAGACRASAAPVADFTPPPALLAARVVTLAAAVTDADPGDEVTGHAWTITRIAAGCDAEPEALDGPSLELVFWCPGTFDVTLVATDRHGVASAPRTRRLEVAPGVGLPTVTAAPVGPVGHACAGDPLTCRLVAPVALSAAGADPTGQPLTWRWTARAPDATRAAAAAAFTPSAEVAAPTVALETAGGAISGGWSFRARVQDPDGNLAQATVEVVVENRPPVVDLAPLGVDHHYLDGTYRASGALPAAATDPDGDPVTLATSFEEPAGTGCGGVHDPVTGGFSIACASAGGLIGGVSRTLRVVASDVNGGAAEASVPIQIRNRLPVVVPAVAGATELALDHSVGPCPTTGSCYLASGTQPFTASDPDGDPISDVVVTPVVLDPPLPHSFAEAGGGSPATFRFGTATGFPLEFRAADGSGGFAVRGSASDPFGASPPVELPVRIRNRPPVVVTRVATAFSFHTHASGEYRAAFTLSTFEDPDGDPLGAFQSQGDPECGTFSISQGTVSVTCRKPYLVSAGGLPPLAAFLGAHPVIARASDGWSGVEVPTVATIDNRPPTLIARGGTVESCICLCSRYDANGDVCIGKWSERLDTASAGLPVVVDDLDGDPLQVTISPATWILVAQRTTYPIASAGTLVSPSLPATWTVTADDGSGEPAATASVTVTALVCSKAGTACAP